MIYNSIASEIEHPLVTAAVIDGSFLIAAVYSKCDLTLVGLFFTIAVGAQGFMSSSLLVNAMDLCPNYAGTLTGAMGTFGCSMGVLVPVVISFLTPNVGSEVSPAAVRLPIKTIYSDFSRCNLNGESYFILRWWLILSKSEPIPFGAQGKFSHGTIRKVTLLKCRSKTLLANKKPQAEREINKEILI